MIQFFSENSKRKNLGQVGAGIRNLLQLKNVDLNYGKFEALKSIDLSTNSGEMIFLTGPSGAGKTSLLRVISGEISPTKGNVVFSSKDIFCATVFQDLRLLGDLTVKENLQIVYDSSVHNFSEFNDEILYFSKILGLSEKLNEKVSKINGGAKQKVAILRALLAKPDILLADEPSSSLDMENTVKILEVFLQYCRKKGTTVIWASHNRELVNKFNGRIIHLDKGRLIYTGNACFI